MFRVILVVAPLLAAVAAPASAAERRFPIDGFTAVGVGGFDHARVAIGGGFSIRAEGLPADLAELRIERRGNALDIDRIKGRHRPGARAVTVYVTMPAITAASVGGSGSIAVDRARADAISLSVGGSGSITVAALDAGHAAVNIGGSGSVAAAGTARDLTVALGGSGRAALRRVTARTATVSISGSGAVDAAVDGDATVMASGSGSVDLGPRSHCTVTRAGSAQVRCGTTR